MHNGFYLLSSGVYRSKFVDVPQVLMLIHELLDICFHSTGLGDWGCCLKHLNPLVAKGKLDFFHQACAMPTWISSLSQQKVAYSILITQYAPFSHLRRNSLCKIYQSVRYRVLVF